MKYQPGLLDLFISPITGKLRTYSQLPNIGQKDYIFVGDQNGNIIPSPSLIDVKLDIIEIRTIVDKIKEARFILQEASFSLSNAQALNILNNGFLYNTGGVLSTQTPGSGNLSLQQDYVYVGDQNNLASGVPHILFSNLPALNNKEIIIGDVSNRPESKTVLYIDNMANLSSTKIWRGDLLGRPVESDALTNAEANIGSALQSLANLTNSVASLTDSLNNLIGIVNGLSTAVNEIETGLATIGGFAAIATLFVTVAGIGASLGSLRNKVDGINLQGFVTGTIDSNGNIVTSRGPNCTLDAIPASNNVSLGDFKIVNLGDPVNPTDAVNLQTLQNSIESLSLSGFVEGNSNSAGEILTTRGPDCTLDVIPAENNVSIYDFKLINLKSDEVEQKDALNAKFLWDLMHDNVEVIWT